MTDKEVERINRLLDNLRITIENKEEESRELETQQKHLTLKVKTYGLNSTSVHDRDGTPICVEDTAFF